MKSKKKKYFPPVIEVIVIKKDEIIATSGVTPYDGIHAINHYGEAF